MKPQSMLSWLEPGPNSDSDRSDHWIPVDDSFGPLQPPWPQLLCSVATPLDGSIDGPWTPMVPPLDGSMVGFKAGPASTAATEEPLQHPWLQVAMASPAWRSAISDGRSQPSRGQPSRIQSPCDGRMVVFEAGTASSSTSAYMPPPRARSMPPPRHRPIIAATPEQRLRSRLNLEINASMHDFFKQIHERIWRQQFPDMLSYVAHQARDMGWMNKPYFVAWVMATWHGVPELQAGCIWCELASNIKGQYPSRWFWVKPESHEHLRKGWPTGTWIHLYMN